MNVPNAIQRGWKAISQAQQIQQINSGLSNSPVWRVRSEHQNYCLKAWGQSVQPNRLRAVQSWVNFLGESIEFVPRIIAADCGDPFMSCGDSLWELTTWLPGHSLGSESITIELGTAAIEAVAQVHECSKRFQIQCDTSQAVLTRIDLLRQALGQYDIWLATVVKNPGLAPSCLELAKQTMAMLSFDGPQLLRRLQQFLNPVQQYWVVRDLHADHILFADQKITGLIDFGAARIDEPLIDIVRLLGSWLPKNAHCRHQLADDYCRQMGMDFNLARFQVLDQTSTLLSSVQWFKWLAIQRLEFAKSPEDLLKRWSLHNDRLVLNEW